MDLVTKWNELVLKREDVWIALKLPFYNTEGPFMEVKNHHSHSVHSFVQLICILCQHYCGESCPDLRDETVQVFKIQTHKLSFMFSSICHCNLYFTSVLAMWQLSGGYDILQSTWEGHWWNSSRDLYLFFHFFKKITLFRCVSCSIQFTLVSVHLNGF